MVELIVCMGIISLLMALLFPLLSRVRDAAKLVQCSSNMRQICTALQGYASSNRGRFPPYDADAAGSNWTNISSMGDWLGTTTLITGGIQGRIVTCPNEPPDTLRSYSMNVWACGGVSRAVLDPRDPAPRGKLWSASTSPASSLMLVLESWPCTGGTGRFFSRPTVGGNAPTAGLSFGAAGGIGPYAAYPRMIGPTCELTYYRHRTQWGTNWWLPTGMVNIGYADGHVAAKTDRELVDAASAQSTLDSLWSPLDPQRR